MRVELSKQEQKALLKMNANTQNRVISALRGLEAFPQAGDIKKLHGKSDEYRRVLAITGSSLEIYQNMFIFST